MIESATGLILRTRPLTETSLIVHWLTRDSGRIATVAKGARRPKSPFVGKLDMFYLADFSFSRSRRSSLHTLRELALRETYPILRQDLSRLRKAAYAAAFVETATEPETPLTAIYDLMRIFLAQLQSGPAPHIIFVFDLKMLQELGLEPDLENASNLTPGAKKIMQTLTQADWPDTLRLRLSRAQFAEIKRFLDAHLLYHLGRVPKSRSAAVATDETDIRDKT